MSGMEIFIVIVLLAALAWGYKRGVVVQLGSLLAIAIAIAVCRIFGDLATDVVAAMFGGEEAVGDPAQSSMTMFVASCIGHVALFLIVWLGVWLLARTVKFVAKSVHLGFVDSVAGALFMLFKTALVISFIINFAKFVAPGSGLATNDGPVMAGVTEVAPWLLGFIQPLAS